MYADLSSSLPMWRESFKPLIVIKPSIMLIAKATDFFNPGQIPVITFDQPLYAINEKIQWNFTSQYEQERFVIMLGQQKYQLKH